MSKPAPLIQRFTMVRSHYEQGLIGPVQLNQLVVKPLELAVVEVHFRVI